MRPMHITQFSILAIIPPIYAQDLWQGQSQPSLSDHNDDTPLPLVIWHGLGDSFNSEGLRSIGALAEAVNPGTFVYYIHVNDDSNSDRSATWFGNVTEHLDTICSQIATHPILSTAPKIDALGFSQGGQFLRGFVERCNAPPVRSLVTFGSQHNGITEFKQCPPTDWLCRSAMSLLRNSVWSEFVQGRLVPAQYYRDPQQYDKYLQHSNFLADINNEHDTKNETYKIHLASLEHFVMFMFKDDTVAIPKETAWFEEVNGTLTLPLRARPLYYKNWLGLRDLDRKGGLKFRLAPGDHMELDEKLLNQTFAEFFGPLKKEFVENVQGFDEL